MFKELLKRLLTKPTYEYKVFTFKKRGVLSELAHALSDEGKKGWKLVHILDNSHIDFKALLQREK